jgi:hypothetical protein
VSAPTQAQRLLDRPVGEGERRALLTVIVMLLASAAVLLAASWPVSRHPLAIRRASTTLLGGGVSSSAPARRPAGNTTPVAAVAARVAHRFLTGYLAYLYGRARSGAITGATTSLARSLRARPPLVSPAMRRRYPHVLSLWPISAPAGMVGVSALIGDGELASYTVGLLLERQHGRLLVSTVEAA